MKERPILFNGPMVRALLDGSKTQTRRVVKRQPDFDTARVAIGRDIPDSAACYDHDVGGIALREGKSWAYVQPNQHCPYGQPSDRLWVREAWRAPSIFDGMPPRDLSDGLELVYEADGAVSTEQEQFMTMGKLRPSIHMPRWASRITLEIVSVRIERLQDISEADAKAEGGTIDPSAAGEWRTNVDSYQQLWESINGSGSWEANPWVWAIEFKRTPL